MPARSRRHPDHNGRVVREISINPEVWEWLKEQKGGASRWIETIAGQEMKDHTVDKLKKQNFNQRAEIARLTDIINSLNG